MDANTEGSSDSSQLSSSNEYMTADELGTDIAAGDEKSRSPVRIVGLMEAIRSGLTSPFKRRYGSKSPAKDEANLDTLTNEGCDSENTNPIIQIFSAQFYRTDPVVISEYNENCHGESPTATDVKDVRYESNLTKYEEDQRRPVFGFDTSNFGARSSSDHAITSQNWRQSSKNRRKRLTGYINPCASDSSDDLDTDTVITQDALIRKASSVFVTDVMRKAISFLTAQEMMQEDENLEYADLQKGDVRFSKDFVFWEEKDDETSPSGDADDKKPKFVPTPYPKKRPGKDRLESAVNDFLPDTNMSDDYQCVGEVLETGHPSPLSDLLDLDSCVVKKLSDEYDESVTGSPPQPEEEWGDTGRPSDERDDQYGDASTLSDDPHGHTHLSVKECSDQEDTSPRSTDDCIQPMVTEDCEMNASPGENGSESKEVTCPWTATVDDELDFTAVSALEINEDWSSPEASRLEDGNPLIAIDANDHVNSSSYELAPLEEASSKVSDSCDDYEAGNVGATSVRECIGDLTSEIIEGLNWAGEAINHPKFASRCEDIECLPVTDCLSPESDDANVRDHTFDQCLPGAKSCGSSDDQSPVTNTLPHSTASQETFTEEEVDNPVGDECDVFTLATENGSSCGGTSSSTVASDEFQDAVSIPIKASDEFDEYRNQPRSVRDELEEMSAMGAWPREIIGANDEVELLSGNDMKNHKTPSGGNVDFQNVGADKQCDDIDPDDVFADVLDNGQNHRKVTKIKETEMDEAETCGTPTDDRYILKDNHHPPKATRTNVESELSTANKMVSVATQIDEEQLDDLGDLENMAEQIVFESIQEAKDVALLGELPEMQRPFQEVECWEDLLEREDEGAMTLSDFEISDIGFLKDELAGMREAIGAVLDERRDESTDGRDHNKIHTPGDETFSQSVQQPIIELPSGSDDEYQVPMHIGEANVEQRCEQNIEDISQTSSDAALRNKITFWEGVARKGPIISEKADRIVTCTYCNDSHSVRPESPVSCGRTGHEYEISEYESDEEYKPLVVVPDMSSPDSPKNVTEVIRQDKMSAANADTYSMSGADESQAETADTDDDRSPSAKVKAKISIWEKLPLRKGQQSGKPSVEWDTSTREKVAFFEHMSTPQGGFHKRSSSPLSFKKDDWLRKFRKKSDLSPNVADISPLVRQPDGAYDSGIWTNQAFFESPTLDVSYARSSGGEVDENLDTSFSGKPVIEDNTSGQDRESDQPVPDGMEEAANRDSQIDKSDVTLVTSNVDEADHDRNTPDMNENVIGTGDAYETPDGSVESLEKEDITGEHEYFLDMIGEKGTTGEPESMSRVEEIQGIVQLPVLEVVGSKMKLHQPTGQEIPSSVDERPSKRKKNKLLSIFRRKSTKQTRTPTEKGPGKEADDFNVEHYIDHKIKKKAKKSQSKDWGFINIDPGIGKLVKDKDEQEEEEDLTTMREQKRRDSRVIANGGVLERPSDEIISEDRGNSGQPHSTEIGAGLLLNERESDSSVSDSDSNFKTAEQSLAFLEMEKNEEEYILAQEEPTVESVSDAHRGNVTEAPLLEVVGSQMTIHAAPETGRIHPTESDKLATKKKKNKLSLFRKKSSKRVIVVVVDIPQQGSIARVTPVGDALPSFGDRPSDGVGSDSKSEVDTCNVTSTSSKKRWKMFRKK